MDFPQIMTSNFNFGEAITMTELCRRSYKVFENHDIKKVKDLYEAMYEDDEWEFVHSMRNNNTDDRLLILKRKDKNQLAVVFRGTIITSGGLQLTGRKEDADIRFVEYKPIPDEPMPPSRNMQVYAGMLEGFEVFRCELEWFLDILLDLPLTDKQIVDLAKIDEEGRDRIISTIKAACLLKKEMGIKFTEGSEHIFDSIKSFIDKNTKWKDFVTEIRKIAEKGRNNQSNNQDQRGEECNDNTTAPTSPVEAAGGLTTLCYRDVIFRNIHEIDIYVAGHSRGGAIAPFAALYFKRYYESKLRQIREAHGTFQKSCEACQAFKVCKGRQTGGAAKDKKSTKVDIIDLGIKMYSVGSTKVGNKAFVDYYNEQMRGFSYRVQNLLDPTIYMPTNSSIPFPYNLELLLPGIDYVRKGDLYYAYYEHVKEAYTVFGAGYQDLALDFGGPLKFTVRVPFPHGPDGYKQMLIEAYEREGTSWQTIGNYLNINFESQKQAFLSLDERLKKIEGKLGIKDEE